MSNGNTFNLKGSWIMETNNTDLEKEALLQYKIILEDWIPTTASIAIAIKDAYIFFSSGHHQIKLAVGEKVKENSIAQKVLITRSKTDAIMDNSLFDAPYYGIGYPIEIAQQPAALVVVLPPNFIKPKQEPYQFLTGKQNEDWTPVPVNEIFYIESLQKRTWFYVNGEQYKTTITLKELQTRLPSIYVRIHRSYIINIHFIRKIKRDLSSNFLVVLKNGTELPISQSYINNLRTILEF